jgi:hypothetical protein
MQPAAHTLHTHRDVIDAALSVSILTGIACPSQSTAQPANIIHRETPHTHINNYKADAGSDNLLSGIFHNTHSATSLSGVPCLDAYPPPPPYNTPPPVDLKKKPPHPHNPLAE